MKTLRIKPNIEHGVYELGATANGYIVRRLDFTDEGFDEVWSIFCKDKADAEQRFNDLEA